MLALGIMLAVGIGQDPLAPRSPFPEAGAGLTLSAGPADGKRLALVIHQSAAAVWAADETMIKPVPAPGRRLPLGAELGTIAGDDVPLHTGRFLAPIDA